jgi:DNA mismatch repair protein MutL
LQSFAKVNRRAVKDGDRLDDAAASALAMAALALPVPRCPHGRPGWVEISRAELYRGVKRS